MSRTINKKILLIATIVSFRFCAFILTYEMKVGIAPIVYLQNDTVCKNDKDLSLIIQEKLNFFGYENILYFSALDSVKNIDKFSVENVMQAVQVCNRLKLEYLIYGYISETSSDVSGELKLFNYRSKKIEKIFFAKDDSEHILRMAEILSNHISEYFCEQLSIKRKKKDFVQSFEIWIPVTFGGWLNLNEVWSDHVIGCVSVNSNFEFKPNFTINAPRCVMDFLFRAEAGTKAAVCNPGFYQGHYFSFQLSAPLIFQIQFAKINYFAFGIGPLCEFELLYMQPKYDSGRLSFACMFCPEYLIEYRCKIGEKHKFLIGIEGVIPVSLQHPVWINLNLGCSFKIK
ncbi:MAG: hypothetical protein ACTTHG_04610 [Treponemataceae bacterium]